MQARAWCTIHPQISFVKTSNDFDDFLASNISIVQIFSYSVNKHDNYFNIEARC